MRQLPMQTMSIREFTVWPKVVLQISMGQVSLGVANVWLSLPLPVAVAHNAVAALLLLAVLTLIHTLYRSGTRRV